MLNRLILIALALHGCLYIPDMSEDKPSKEGVEEIVEGSSTRKEVISRIGEPDFTALGGLIAIYDYSRVTGHVIGLPIPVSGVGVIGNSFYNPIEKLESTQIEYRDDVVVSISSISDGYGCYINGVCLDSGWTILGGPRLVPAIAALSTSGVEDQNAKKLSLPVSGCNLYIYVVGGVRSDYPVIAAIDNAEIFPLSLANYLNLEVPPGRFSLKVFHSGTAFVTNSEKEFLAESTMSCKKPSVDFVEIRYELGQQGPNTRTANVSLASQEKGLREILGRRLLLSR
jgi:hypothetical protein